MDLTDDSAFDLYALERGWAYDNSGLYRGESWNWYAGPVANTVLMRQPPRRLAIVRYDGLAPTEIWSGCVSTPQEFDEMIRVVAAKDGT